MDGQVKKKAILNGICPYFTMFPLDFPYDVLNRCARTDGWVLDPFCGRGTTNYASRILGLPSVGIDSSRVAVAISEAKLANTSPQSISRIARRILNDIPVPNTIPESEFWRLAFDTGVLHTVCRLREGLLKDCRSDARKALRAVIMGSLHGPLLKGQPSYLSNQCQRTYAPKPRYAINFWRTRGLLPPSVDVLDIIKRRAERYYLKERPAVGKVIFGDSRDEQSYVALKSSGIRWIITSPPYYGMRTYIPDQWLRSWVLGGPPDVDYSNEGQVAHSSQEIFAEQLSQVWKNVAVVSDPEAQLVIRFGGINDRKADPLAIIRQSLEGTGWLIKTIKPAGMASQGRRQALHFSSCKTKAIEEHDVWATWVK